MVAIKSLSVIFVLTASLVGNSLADPASLLKLVNAERAKANVDPLILDDRLIKAAEVQSNFQAKTKTMTHDNSESGDLGTRLKNQGFNFQTAGENVAFGFTTEASVMNTWMNSPGHRANILNKNFKRFGSADTDNYWTQDFGTLFDDNGQPGNNTPKTSKTPSTPTPKTTPTPKKSSGKNTTTKSHRRKKSHKKHH